MKTVLKTRLFFIKKESDDSLIHYHWKLEEFDGLYHHQAKSVIDKSHIMFMISYHNNYINLY